MRAHLPDFLILCGAVLVPGGVAMFSLPVALVVAGLELILLGYQVARRPHGG